MACLVLDFEGLDVLTHELIGDAVTIGRAPSNDIVIDHPTVSAQHARLTKSPSGYRIKDLESTNGTQINGVSISDAQLKNEAEIRFGYNRNGAWKACRSQLLFLAEFLESGIGTQGVPDWIEPKKCRRDGRWTIKPATIRRL
jgi:pSer/pThr/pTyr-binding forkhead associated (FHA) protein